MHAQKNEVERLNAKLRALDGSRGTEGVDATSIRHQQTFSFPNISYLDNYTELFALP